MNDVWNPWSLVCGVLLFFSFVWQQGLRECPMRFLRAGGFAPARRKLLAGALKAGTILLCYALRPAPVCLYLIVFLVIFFACKPLAAQSGVRFWFWTHLRFLHFSALHMICLAAVSLYCGVTLRGAYDTARLWLAAMLLTVCLLACVSVVQRKVFSPQTLRLLFGDVKRLKRLIAFEWFAAGYVLFDAYTMIGDLPYRLLAWLLIGSSALLLLQFYLFLFHALHAILNAHYETEYYRLEAERAERVKAEMRLRSLTYTDHLTGAYSRRYAISLLESMLRDAEGLSLAYIDLNGLKKVNDSAGHLAGDRYLLLATECLHEQLRAGDTLARIGGDEFLVIAPKADRRQLEERLERANRRLRAERIAGLPLSFSFGVAETAGGAPESAQALLRRSDALMYAQKKKACTGGSGT